MQLEQQETFEIKGPQLAVLGEAESKLPAPARRRPFADLVLALAIVLAVFGIGGARLRGARGAVLAQFSASDRYNQGLLGDMYTQAGAAASLVRQAADVLGEGDSTVAEAWQALDGYDVMAQAPDAAYFANARLYSAVDALYNVAAPKAGGDTAERIEELYATFVSAQATIDRAGAQYNEAARAYNKTAAGFPANIVGALWGAGRVPLFEPSASADAAATAPMVDAAAHTEDHDEAHHD